MAAAVTPGDHILVLGATGVTGSIAVQLATWAFGAGRVVVAGRDETRLEWLRGAGADELIALRREDLGDRVRALHAERPFDAVLEYLWGQPAEQVLEALGSNGLAAVYHHVRYVQIGAMAGATMLNLPAGILRSTAITIAGVGLGTMPPEILARVRAEALPRMFDMVASGQTSPGHSAAPAHRRGTGVVT